MSPWRVDGGDNLDLKPGQAYADFAIEIFKKHGIKNIEKLDPHGYSSVKISDIDDSDLKVLVEKELDDAEIPENGTEIVGSFSGGLVLISENGTVINHQCCGSISDYKNWKEFLKKSPENWEQIWIGHPWIYGRINDDALELSDYIEHTGTLEVELPVKVQVDLDEFIKALDKAIEELMDLKKRILEILKIEMIDISEELTELLIENEYH